MIQDPKHEKFAGFIGIDDFDEIDAEKVAHTRTYYACTQIFKVEDGKRLDRNYFFFGTNSDFYKKGKIPGLQVHREDTFLLPTIEGYMLFGLALKKQGYRYNKKTCQLTKINSK